MQLSLFPETSGKPLLAETPPDLSARPDPSLNQKIYECPSHHNYYYFKYVCSLGHKLLIQRWIPGGNTSSRTARRRAAQVKTWIVAGVPPAEIDSRIQAWGKRRSAKSLRTAESK